MMRAPIVALAAALRAPQAKALNCKGCAPGRTNSQGDLHGARTLQVDRVQAWGADSGGNAIVQDRTEGSDVFSERTIRLYEEHKPAAPEGSSAPTLSELLHEVEVAAQVGVPRDELARQLGLHSELFDALVGDAGVSLG